jgi:LuxR family maltose regulon positive regulatory protein
LLVTKFYPPHLPAQHVARPRLTELLDTSILRPLTLVSAPAGSGKTTLLAEWASMTAVPVAWVSLEAADNDPARFLAYFQASLARLEEKNNLATDLVSWPASEQDYERVLTHILNDLTCRLQQDVVVILDDAHLLTSEAVHGALQFLLDHLPTRLHLIIGTRVDPPLPLARWRVRGQLSEVRTEELRFVPFEIEALVGAMGLVLSEEATSLLEQRTEGWIAGIQLLTLALRTRVDAAAFLHAFHGTHRFFLDYVREEILAQQTPEVQHFLLHTCILERMTGSLCDALTDQSDGQAQLAFLVRANLFVSALDETDTWYRYHPLFAEALRTQLEKREPELVPELFLRASRWYEEHQGMEEACEYAFQAGDLSLAASLCAELLPRLVEQGRFEQLGRWLAQIPPALVTASPQLSVAMPWVHMMHALDRQSPRNRDIIIEQLEQYIQSQQQDISTAWIEPKSVLTLTSSPCCDGKHNRRGYCVVRVLKSGTRSKKCIHPLCFQRRCPSPSRRKRYRSCAVEERPLLMSM